MNREQLKQQLLATMRQGGVDDIFKMYMETCLPFGAMPQVGMLASQMIEEILNKKFPPVQA